MNNTFFDVANRNCKIAISNCKVTKLNCDVANRNCEIAISNCKIAKLNCDVANRNCEVAISNCKVANYFCEMVFVKIWLFGKYCLTLTYQKCIIMEKSKQKRTFAEIVNKSRLMIAGLRNNSPEVTKRGIDPSFVSQYESELQELERLDAEQERLKAELKLKTEETLAKRKQVENKLSEAKKVVKLSLPQAKWVEFGMEDKR